MAEVLSTFGEMSKDAQCIIGMIVVGGPFAFLIGISHVVSAFRGGEPPPS